VTITNHRQNETVKVNQLMRFDTKRAVWIIQGDQRVRSLALDFAVVICTAIVFVLVGSMMPLLLWIGAFCVASLSAYLALSRKCLHQTELDVARTHVRVVKTSLLGKTSVSYYQFSDFMLVRSCINSSDESINNQVELILKANAKSIVIARFNPDTQEKSFFSLQNPNEEHPQARELRKALARLMGVRDLGFSKSWIANPVDL
jgi:uncharacterized membrane protein